MEPCVDNVHTVKLCQERSGCQWMPKYLWKEGSGCQRTYGKKEVDAKGPMERRKWMPKDLWKEGSGC